MLTFPTMCISESCIKIKIKNAVKVPQSVNFEKKNKKNKSTVLTEHLWATVSRIFLLFI